MRCLLLVLLATLPSTVSASLVTNGSFETSEPIGGIPTTFGDWGEDLNSIVTSQMGITPFDGTQMLKFENTDFTGPSGGFGADVLQLIDFSSVGPVTASARFNRVAGGPTTDTMFRISLLAFSGTTTDAANANFTNALSMAQATLISDSDVDTWELLSVQLDLPVGTTFILVGVSGIENVVNDTMSPEFAGHFADGVRVTSVPEPSSLAFLAMGSAFLAHRKRRRGRRRSRT